MRESGHDWNDLVFRMIMIIIGNCAMLCVVVELSFDSRGFEISLSREREMRERKCEIVHGGSDGG